jgi:hypothetical protein
MKKGHVYEVWRAKNGDGPGVLMMQSNLPGLNPCWLGNAVPTWTFCFALADFICSIHHFPRK